MVARLLVVVAAALCSLLAAGAVALARPAQPTAELADARAAPGEQVEGTGRGFEPALEVRVHFGGPDGPLLWSGPASADLEGTVAFAFVAPDVSPGHYDIVAYQLAEREPVEPGTTARAVLEIIAPAAPAPPADPPPAAKGAGTPPAPAPAPAPEVAAAAERAAPRRSAGVAVAPKVVRGEAQAGPPRPVVAPAVPAVAPKPAVASADGDILDAAAPSGRIETRRSFETVAFLLVDATVLLALAAWPTWWWNVQPAAAAPLASSRRRRRWQDAVRRDPLLPTRPPVWAVARRVDGRRRWHRSGG